MNNWLRRDGEEEAGKGRKRKKRGGRGRKGRRNGNGEGETLLWWDRRRLKRSRTRWWRMRRKRKWLRRGAWGGFLWLLAASWELVCMDCHFLNNRFSTNRFGVHALTLYNWASRYTDETDLVRPSFYDLPAALLRCVLIWSRTVDLLVQLCAVNFCSADLIYG